MILYLLHYLNMTLLLSLKCRLIGAFFTALIITLCLGPMTIRLLTTLKYGQSIREVGPKSHLKKSGTPTMGGVLMVLAIILATLLWANWSSTHLWLALAVLFFYAVLGFYDDYLIIKYKNNKGISGKFKFMVQSIIALVVGCVIYHQSAQHHYMFIPFAKLCFVPMGVGVVIWTWFIVVGSSNAVNLTDGLDGLAIVPIMLVAFGFICIIFFAIQSNVVGFKHHDIDYQNLAIICVSIIGTGLGFLWFNAKPAQIFMGDVGSLSLGGLLGCLAILLHASLIYAIMGGIFIVETLSVILQVGSYKLRKKRIFKMAPIHHHFELKGWAESKISVRFWIISVILVCIGLWSVI